MVGVRSEVLKITGEMFSDIRNSLRFVCHLQRKVGNFKAKRRPQLCSKSVSEFRFVWMILKCLINSGRTYQCSFLTSAFRFRDFGLTGVSHLPITSESVKSQAVERHYEYVLGTEWIKNIARYVKNVLKSTSFIVITNFFNLIYIRVYLTANVTLEHF